MDTILAMEERALNAWPPLQTVHFDGWILAFSASYGRRANSVYALRPSLLPIGEKLDCCEHLYASKAQPTIYKMTAAVEPDNLDAILAARGYVLDGGETSVQVLNSLGDLPDPSPQTPPAIWADRVTDAWADTFLDLSHIPDERRATARQIFANVVPEHAFAMLCQDDQPVALGMAVLERGYVGIFSVVTAPELRNHGLGRQLMRHLLEWGKSQGAAHAYLQVMLDNAPAQHLYAQLGFRELYRYWYRTKPIP